MREAKQQRSLNRAALAVVVLFTIALVLILSIAATSGAGHGFDRVALAFPLFFLLFFLAMPIGDWLRPEDFFLEARPRHSTSRTRAPPA